MAVAELTVGLMLGIARHVPAADAHIKAGQWSDPVDAYERFRGTELAGKTVSFHAQIKGVRQKEVPDLDDDFAAELGDFQTLDEARSSLREKIGDTGMVASDLLPVLPIAINELRSGD